MRPQLSLRLRRYWSLADDQPYRHEQRDLHNVPVLVLQRQEPGIGDVVQGYGR